MAGGNNEVPKTTTGNRGEVIFKDADVITGNPGRSAEAVESSRALESENYKAVYAKMKKLATDVAEDMAKESEANPGNIELKKSLREANHLVEVIGWNQDGLATHNLDNRHPQNGKRFADMHLAEDYNTLQDLINTLPAGSKGKMLAELKKVEEKLPGGAAKDEVSATRFARNLPAKEAGKAAALATP